MYSLQQSNTLITFATAIKSHHKLPRTVVVLFSIYLYMFGMDFGLKKILNKKVRVLTIGVQVVMFIAISTILFTTLTRAKPNETHYFFFAFNYLIRWVIAIHSKYNICDLMLDIHPIIDNKKVTVENKVATLTYLMFANFVLKIAICCVGCVVYSEECSSLTTPPYIYCIPAGGMDGLTIIPIYASYYIYLSVKYIEKSLDKIDIKTLQANYMTIANCWDKIKPLHNQMVSYYYS